MREPNIATSTTSSHGKSMRILLRLPNWLGDSVMISPTFEWLKNAYPSATFTLVGSKAACGIYEREERVEQLIIDTSKDKAHKGLMGFFARIKNVSSLAKRIGGHDISITFTNNFFSALLLYLTKSPVRIGYARECRSPLLTHALKLERSLPNEWSAAKLHQVQLYLRLITPLPEVKELYRIYTQAKHYGDKSKTPSLLEFLSTQDLYLIDNASRLDSASQIATKAPCKSVRIGINPGAAFGSAKRWRQEYFITCIEHFLTQGYEVYLFGSSSESSANTAIAHAITHHANAHLFYDLTDSTSLSSLIDTICDLDVFISNDSGPMHIASALQIPLVAIFGPTDLGETAPYTPHTDSGQSKTKPQILLYKALPCSPCKKRECPLKEPESHQCMKAITPSEVIQATHTLLSTQKHSCQVISESSQDYPS